MNKLLTAAIGNCHWIKNGVNFASWVLITTIVGGALMSEKAFANDTSKHYNIAAQSLNNALMRFAAESNLELIFNADMVRGLNTKRLAGNMTPAQALTLLLQDSGVTYRFVDEHTVTLKQRREPGAKKTSEQDHNNYKLKNKPKPALKLAPVTLEMMTVTGEAGDDSTSYQVTTAYTATKTDTPIKEIPQSIQVIPHAVINDQQNITVSESLRNVSGVITRNILYTPVIEGTLIRGFSAEQLLDGFTQYYNPGDRESMVNIDRIEVLKGSNAVLYSGGSGSPVGGVVNVISKLPKPEAFGEAGMRLGSNSFYQPYIDLNQPLTNNALFRITGEYTNSGSFIDVINTDRFNINPALTFTNNDTTTFTLQGKVSRWQQPDYQGLPAFGTVAGTFNVRPKTFIGPQNIPDSHSDSDAVWGTLDHKFNKTWTFNFKARYAQSEFDQKVQTLFGADGFQADQPLYAPSTWALANAELFQHQQEFSLSGNAVAKFNVGPTENTVLLGSDFSELNDEGFVDGDLGALGFGVGMVDLNAPEFSVDYGKPGPGVNNQLVKNTTYGGYVQLQSTLYNRFHLLTSVRLGNVSVDFKNTATGVEAQTDELKPLPRVGGVVDVTDEVSLFAGYGEGMRGQPFLNFVGAPSPALSRQIEGGVKFDVANQLSGQLAVYQIDRSHVAVTDTSDFQFRSIAEGQQRSRGFETDLVWQPIDSLSFLGSYAHTEAKFTDNRAGVPEGNSLNLVPENSGRLWANYRFQQAALKGLSIGSGVYLQSQAFLANDNRFKSDGYYSFDAAIAYETGHFKLATTVKNLTNERNFEAYDYFDGRAAPAAGTSVYATASVRY